MFGKIILKWVILASNIVAVLLMLVTYIGSILSPEQFILPAYFALAYPIIITLNAGYVIFWILARKWYFLISLSVLLFSTSQINNTIPIRFGTIDTITVTHPINILTYNTMMSGKLVKHTKRKPNMVIQHIIDSDADIVCLQEFMVSRKSEYQTHADMMLAFRKYPYKHIWYTREVNTKVYGIATFSKFPIINKQRIKYPTIGNASIYTDLKIYGETIRVVNNHLESNRLTEIDKAMPLKLKDHFDAKNLTGLTLHFSQKLGMAYKYRAKQADIVSNIVKESPFKVILCGDFNDVPSSYAYTTVKGDLKDAFSEIGNGFGWTYNEGLYRFRIDYVMYDSTAFIPVKYELDKVKYSDHYPVKCVLELRKPATSNE